MKDLLSFRSCLSFFCSLLSLSSIIVLSILYDSHNSSNNVLLSQPSSQISKVIQTAAAISGSNYYYFQSSSRDAAAAAITNIQLPGIISNNNSSSPIFPNTYPPTSQSLYPPPPPIIHNTRAPAALGGPTLNDPNLKVQKVFTGDVDHGRLYNFKLNEDRTGLALDGPLAEKIANTPEDLKEGGAVFGQGFGVITDMQVGPDDGYLYILTLNGSIYRIVPSCLSF